MKVKSKMKYKDVIFTVLSEVTGKSVEQIRQDFPMPLDTPAMEKELTEVEAAKLLEDLRNDKNGIFNRLLQGLK